MSVLILPTTTDQVYANYSLFRMGVTRNSNIYCKKKETFSKSFMEYP